VIILVNFVIVQAAPGGPVEQAIAHLQGIGGAASAAASETMAALARQPWPGPETDQGHRKTVRLRQAGAERLWLMLKNYAQLDFGKAFSRRHRHRPDPGKMPVTISLGLWATLITYLVSIPLGIRKAVHTAATSMSGAAPRSSSATRCRRFCLRCC
jgi:microcin C transport system permease protein